MGISVFGFTQLFSKAKERSSRPTGATQNLTRNSHSRLFKVTRFGISGKPTRDSVTLYNNAGLISNVCEDMASENTENCRCRQLHCRLTLSPGNTANIRINFILPVSRVLNVHFLSLTLWVCLHSHFRAGFRKTHALCNRVHNGKSRSSNVVDFGTNRKRVCDFLLVINSNLSTILHRF